MCDEDDVGVDEVGKCDDEDDGGNVDDDADDEDDDDDVLALELASDMLYDD
jgi:hypothetical protein